MPDWRTVQLHDVADIRVSNVDKKAVAGELPVKLCNYMDVYGNDYIRADLPFMEATATAVEIERFGVRRGDVMITKDSETPDDIGIPAVVTHDVDGLVCGYHLAQLRPRAGVVDPTYLAKQLSLPATSAYFAQRATGSTRYGLSTRTIAQTPFRLAPLVEQQRIAAILSSLDTAIEATEALIEKHQQINAGLMHDLLTRGISRSGQLRPRATDAPELYRSVRDRLIPLDWHEVELQSVADVSRGKFTHRPRNDPRFLGGPHPFIQTGDIAAAAGDYLTAYSQTLSDLGASVSSRFPAGTVAVTIAANIADTAILSAPMFFPDSVVGVVVRPVADVRFIELCIRLSKPKLEAMAPQSAQRNINLQDLRPLKVMLPPLAEQVAISQRYEAALEQIRQLRAQRNKLHAQKQGLMQDLLTGKVRVPVPADASA